jgi:Protein of unknown function (DUF998)
VDINSEIETVTSARIRRIRLAAELGIAGQVALVVGSVVATLLQDGKYDAARDEMSDMAAIGVPHAWVVLVYMGFAGATAIVFGWAAMRPLLAGVKGRTLAAVLLSLTWGLGNLSDSLFRIDCRVADGCTIEQQVQSWHAVVHASSSILFLPLLFAPFVVARALRRSPDWADLSRTSRWFGLGIVLAIVASVLLTGQWGAGYVQRLLLTLGAVWIGLLARRAVQLTRPPAKKRPGRRPAQRRAQRPGRPGARHVDAIRTGAAIRRTVMRLRRSPVLVATTATLVLAGGALTATAAHASDATVSRYEETTTFSDTVTDDCRGVDGTITGTNVFAYQEVVTLDSDGNPAGYHLTGTSTDTFRLDFVDGSYGVGSAVTRPIANVTEPSGVSTYTEAHVDDVTVYAADGQQLLRLMFHETVHFTLVDGTVRADVEQGHFSLTC